MKDKHFVDNNALSICTALSILALAFIVFGHKYKDQVVQRTLTKAIVELPGTTVDFWSVSHLLLFMAFGLVLPNRHVPFFLVGITWEVAEDIISADETTRLGDCKTHDKSKVMCKFSINDGYWYAKWDDVFFNLIGYTIGSAIRTTCFDD